MSALDWSKVLAEVGRHVADQIRADINAGLGRNPLLDRIPKAPPGYYLTRERDRKIEPRGCGEEP